VLYFFATSCAPVGLSAMSSTSDSHPDADYVAVDIDQRISAGQVRQYLAAAGAGGLAVAADGKTACGAARYPPPSSPSRPPGHAGASPSRSFPAARCDSSASSAAQGAPASRAASPADAPHRDRPFALND
jgi:hypothetical protein